MKTKKSPPRLGLVGTLVALLSFILLSACGDSTPVTLPATATTAVSTTLAATATTAAITTAPAATTAVATTAPATTAAVATTVRATTAAPTTALVTTVATTSAATTAAVAGTIAPATTASVSTTQAPVATPAARSNNPAAVTPVALGPAEAPLKATGFSGDSAKAFLDELTTQIGIRVVATEGEKKAADWMDAKFRSFGYTQVTKQEFPVTLRVRTAATATAQASGVQAKGLNVIATRPGPNPNAKVLIFGGHYDTVPGTVGASDNASGAVITLELARVLFQKFPEYELRFIQFGGEEAGLLGSAYYAQQLPPEEKQRIVAFINLDALGVGDRFVAIGSPDMVTMAIDVASRNGIRLEQFSLGGTGAGSDHESFIRNGMKSVFLARWLDPLLHNPGDTPDRVYSQTLLLSGGLAILIAQRILGV